MERKEYVDYIKAIGMILVVAGHVNFANAQFKVWIYSFHMPVFFFATGLVLKKHNLNKKYFEKKFIELLIPYILWGLIYAKFTFKNFAKIMWGSYQTISSAETLTSLWFLPAMYCAIIIAQMIFNSLHDKIIPLLIAMTGLALTASLLPTSSIGYPWSLNASIMGSSFIIMGSILAKCTYEKKNIMVAVLLISLSATALSFFNKSQMHGYVLMATGDYGNPLFFAVTAISGCIAIYSFSILLVASRIKSKILSYIGKNTLVIFAIQKPIIQVFERIFSKIKCPQLIMLIITVLGTIAVSLVFCEIINRYIKSLAGKSRVEISK